MGAQELDHSMGDDEETLSLSDLVIRSDANEYWNDDYFSKEDPQSAIYSSSSSDHEGFFEFFSEDFSASAAASASSGIDDNIIFCGKVIPYKDQQQSVEEKSQSLKSKGEKNTSSHKFPWKNKSRTFPPVKSRWYLFAFGVGRLPMEMEFKDMKMRQSRKSKAIVKVQPDGGGGPENVKVSKEQRRSTKGLWRLLKILGWKNSKHKNVVV